MGDHTAQLEQMIARERDDLGDNLEELAMKAKALTDWRMQVDAHPLGMMSLAVGGGAVLAALTSRRKGGGGPARVTPQARRHPSLVTQLARDIQSALGAVAVAAAVDFLGEAVPGFGDHFRKAGGK